MVIPAEGPSFGVAPSGTWMWIWCLSKKPGSMPSAAARERAQAALAGLHEGVRRLANPHRYPVGLERGLHERRTQLVLAARGLDE